MRYRVRVKTWPVLMALLFIPFGCLRLAATESPRKSQFILEVSRPKCKAKGDSNAILRVAEFAVSPPYQGSGFKYRRREFIFESDFYNEFFIPPGEMLAGEVRRWLDESGLFEVVVSGSTYLIETHILEGTVHAFYVDYRGGFPEAVLDLEFVLIREGGAGSGIVFKNQYGRRIPAPDGPVELVGAWNQALYEILSDLEKDLQAQLNPGRPDSR